MWLNGFNDNLPGFPRSPCKYIPCSAPYMGEGHQPGAPVDPTKPMQGPYGTGMSGPSFGLCPVGRDWIKEKNPMTGREWVQAPPKAPSRYDDTDNVMTLLAYKKISAYSGVGHGFYFWNFRTDVEEPHWSYLLALERGWIPKGNFNVPKIQDACRSEDENLFKCYVKPEVPDANLRKAVDYIFNQTKGNDTDFAKQVEGIHVKLGDMKGKELKEATNDTVSQFFDENKMAGITCDFGGIAMWVEENQTITDDDFVDWDVAYFADANSGGRSLWQLSLIISVGVIVGSALGFILGMHFNKGFNHYFQTTKMGRRMTKSNNTMLKKTLSITDLGAALDFDDDYGNYEDNYGSTENNALLRRH